MHKNFMQLTIQDLHQLYFDYYTKYIGIYIFRVYCNL